MCSFGSCQTRFEFLSQEKFEKFRNTGANAFAKNQTRLAYEDKRDLYCRFSEYNRERLNNSRLQTRSSCVFSRITYI